ncbi:MAG TPA: CaiB/BaiF CoA-transferase family protein [Steroidobacteraceae bacterium]|nr:CaiB/BaiF CoA-transferase family protein [Steroidobacteraceae bacterium]
MAGPLQGIRVLDLSRILAGPWCTQLLADLGAEVIKIERPGAGDDTRHWGPPWLTDTEGRETRESAYYLSANRGKHSVTLDISRPEGREIVERLVAQSDVLIENFKTGDLARKGLGYEQMRAINPRIIYCSITGFGQTGPRASQAGYDYLVQGMGGLMSITGIPDGEPGASPLRVGVAVGDLSTGLYAAVGILAALHHRNVSGEGQYIDLALLDTVVGMMANQGQNYFVSGQVPQRTGAEHPNLAPYRTFATSDGHIIIAVGNDAQFRKLCAVLSLAALADDPRFLTNANRVQHRGELAETIEAKTRAWTLPNLVAALAKMDVPSGPINTLKEVFEDPQVRHHELKVELPHPLSGQVSTIRNPLRFSETPATYTQAPPLLGEHTEDVLTRVAGLSAEDIARLRKIEVI